MPIENCDYFIKIMPFPVPIPAFIRLNAEDDTYTMYINSNLDYEHQLDGYIHELWHIIRDDIYSDRSIFEIEPQLEM